MDQHMKATLDEARLGAEEGGVPIGAALVDVEGNLVATGRNPGSRSGPWSCTPRSTAS